MVVPCRLLCSAGHVQLADPVRPVTTWHRVDLLTVYDPCLGVMVVLRGSTGGGCAVSGLAAAS